RRARRAAAHLRARGPSDRARRRSRHRGPGSRGAWSSSSRRGTVEVDVDVKVKPGPGERMRIGELARRAGVSTRTLRYYEEQGLLTPRRLPNGYRSYDEDAVEQVRRIRYLLAAGIGTEMAREVLPCVRDDGDALVPECDELVEALAQ